MDTIYEFISNKTSRFIIFLFIFFLITAMLFGQNQDDYDKRYIY